MAVADVPFDLVEVKLAAPQARPGTTAKRDVIERLCQSQVPCVSVVAPAGYGKTTLLARWAEADPRPFAWVALDGVDDDDAVMFLRYIAAAIHSVEPLSSEVFAALSGPGGSTWSKRVPRVGSALAALERPLVLVLDDLHAVRNPSCLDAIAALLGYLPAGSQIAIASREEPALPLARWRARGLVHEIGVADLRLGRAGGRAAVGRRGRAAGRERTVRADRAHGGLARRLVPRGAVVAGRRVERGERPRIRRRRPLRCPSTSASSCSRGSRQERRGSCSTRRCSTACAAVSATPCSRRTRSAQTLETFERTNGFVVPLDRRGEWYRYHHLFGELLRNELERSEPQVVPALNRRAMDWCIANDLTEAAIAYGHAAGETDTVAGLLDALALPLYYDGRMETLEEWLAWFDDDELRQYPALAVSGAWLRALTGRPAEAERWLALAEGATSRIPLSDGTATIEPWIAEPARGHDARWCRAGDRRRRSGAGSPLP